MKELITIEELMNEIQQNCFASSESYEAAQKIKTYGLNKAIFDKCLESIEAYGCVATTYTMSGTMFRCPGWWESTRNQEQGGFTYWSIADLVLTVYNNIDDYFARNGNFKHIDEWNPEHLK